MSTFYDDQKKPANTDAFVPIIFHNGRAAFLLSIFGVMYYPDQKAAEESVLSLQKNREVERYRIVNMQPQILTYKGENSLVANAQHLVLQCLDESMAKRNTVEIYLGQTQDGSPIKQSLLYLKDNECYKQFFHSKMAFTTTTVVAREWLDKIHGSDN